ncbi:hypothetical protein Cni_G18761 [Canna indica]|uniref:Growth-regulating factor n=1 Tax=Canna indica TaxID=4628 RepID=A0AAQ3KPX1_9LILI|nr:hypothetical protein Cni_G18761 [Canna indica]
MAEERKSQSSLEHDEEEDKSPPPHKVARLSSDEAGVASILLSTPLLPFTLTQSPYIYVLMLLCSHKGIVTMAAPSPLMLGLGLGLGRGQGASKPVFTFMQLQELEHQALIFKYMAAGLPVPVHLVIPIWKSVAASSFGSYHYPSCCPISYALLYFALIWGFGFNRLIRGVDWIEAVMGYGGMCLDYRNSMEPEPGRCRRTDGKKWRCSRDVVPDQKYCERHMHRGRNRPRKPVEAGTAGGGAATAPPCSTQLSISVSAGGRTANDGGRVVSPPELGLSRASVIGSGSACKTATS